MVNKAVCVCLLRIVLPFSLIAAVIFRQNVLSLLYLLLLLVAPVVSNPSPKTMAGNTGRYLKTVLAVSISATIAQIIFQIVLLSMPPYGSFLQDCTHLEKLLRLIGFQRYDHINPFHIVRLIGPEVLMLIVSVVVFVPCSQLAALASSSDTGASNGDTNGETPLCSDKTEKRSDARRKSTIFSALGDVIALILLAGAGIIRPSVISSTYFLAFLAIATWVAFYKKLKRKFAFVRVFLLSYAALHLIVLYVYQTEYLQELLPPTTLYARLFGLTGIVQTSCATDPRSVTFLDLEWATYVNPAILLSLYWVLVLETRLWLQSPHVLEPLKPYQEGIAGYQTMVFLSPTPTGVSSIPSQTPSTPRSSLQASQHSLRRTRSEKPSSFHRRTKSSRRRQPAKRPTSNEEFDEKSFLLSADESRRHYNTVDGGSDGNERIEIDPNGSVILSNVDTDLPPSEEARRQQLSRLRNMMSPLMAVFLLITRQSYVATLIVMMAWSITYHSWLTFILLLWSCILWMIPNSRKACLRSSPALVFYAQGLLVIQYVYCLSLTDDELPQKVEAVNLKQIGLVKYPHLPCLPLAAKVLYTVMFWITMRQFMEERFQKNNRDIVDGVMMQPFNMAFSTAQAGSANLDVQHQRNVQSSPFMKNLGDFVLRMLTTYWIWVVACMLMIISLQGEKVVIFRIMYMALFLFFILNFQLSYKLWRSTMYVFWLTVIIYSMLVLILIYTYQFENFPYYWSQYLYISVKLQRDIGLESYDTGQLFLKLLPPTFFVVITIIQLHYFHKDFLRMSDIEHRSAGSANEPCSPKTPPPPVAAAPEYDESNMDVTPDILGAGDSSAVEAEIEARKQISDPRPVIVGIPSTPTGDDLLYEEQYKSVESKKADVAEMSFQAMALHYMKLWAKHGMHYFNLVSEVVWRFLEIHMMKIVLFSALMLAVHDVCAVHVVLIVLVTVALPCRPLQLCISHCCAIWTSVLLLSKMIYQIDYIEEIWTVNCTDVENVSVNHTEPFPFNEPINNAHWLGYNKVVDLPDYLKGYVGLILVLSIQAVVRVRQRYHRNQNLHMLEPKYGVIFPKITRANADTGLLECAQYLVNYGFYKFGVEINYVTMVAVIGVRLDICAVIYAIWLGGMFNLKRTTLARVWPFYVAFLAILLPLQYGLCVGMPPGFCVEYPWSLDFMHPELREWLFLPDFAKPLAAYKLAVDFFQLLFACCQLFVFQLESTQNSDQYEGGSNRELIYSVEPEPEENYSHDFVTYTKSYLDLVKVIVFSMFYWATLAIIFLAGTNRVSLFAMGYVIGCFLFLWNGQEFYLKPLKTILRLWNTLLAYNIFVIFTKTILQLIGCVFLDKLLDNFCWTVQLFGIACLKKFDKQYSAVTNLGGCVVPKDEAGLLWDGICLGFMLLQRRLFCSHYFRHLVAEMHAQTKLASRGAELINQLLMKEVREQEAAEKEIVQKIKQKMDRIRANQQKIRGKAYSEPEGHFEAELLLALSSPSAAVFPKPLYSASADATAATQFDFSPDLLSSPRLSLAAIRSGDYFMFEEYSDDGLAELEFGERKSDDKEEEVKGMSVSKLIASAMKGDIKHAVSEAKHSRGGQSPDTGNSRHTSSGPTDISGRPPVSRTVSAVSGSSSLPIGMSVSRQASLRSQGYAEMEKAPAFATLQPTVDGRGLSYDEFGANDQAQSPPLPDLESALKASGGGGGGGDGDEDDEFGHRSSSEKGEEEGFCAKLVNWLKFAWAFIEGVMFSATVRLNSISKDYRYVARCLAKEKQLMKEKGLVSADSLKADYTTSLPFTQFQPLTPKRDEPLEIRVEKASEDDHTGTYGSIECLDTPEELEKEFEKDQPVIVRLLIATWYAIASRSEIVCYVMIMINQIKSASLVSLPLPLMAFLWGSLSIPRPTKTFWITIITYTEAVVLVKYLFQFEFFPWNYGDTQATRLNAPFWPPRIVGVEKKPGYAVYDLTLLMVVFFHRFILKSLGLWKDESDSIHCVDSQEVASKSTDEKKSNNDADQSEELVDKEDVNFDDYDFEDDESKSNAFLDCVLQYVFPFKRFFHNLFHPSYRVTVDVYAYMFLCDFVTFLILVFGYWAFGTGGGDGVASYFEDNKVPIPFLVMLIAQFGLIIIDRALFLRKFILGKVVFQVFMVFLVHLWMFFVLPAVSEREFNSSMPPQLWYFVKCVYLLLSAYQIRSGYPTRILGNFLTKKYNYLNMFLFRGFMAIPFLFELRALMDWIWTDTSMSLSSWLKMEDIFANIFLLKCQRRAEAEYPTPRGERRQPAVKYGMGGGLLFVIIFIIWFPLVLFALANTVGTPNKPNDVTIEITFGGYEPLFKMSAQHNALKQFSKADFDDLLLWYSKERDAQFFLQNFDERDIVMAELNVNSTAVWGISPPSQQQLIKDLMSKNRMTLKLSWYVSRTSNSSDVLATVGDEQPYNLDGDNPIRNEFAMMLNGSSEQASVLVPNLFPKFILVPSRGKASYIKQLNTDPITGQIVFNNLTLSLRTGSFINMSRQQEWWEAREDCASSPFRRSPFPKDCTYLRLFTVNDKVFPPTLSVFSGYGIVGMYTTLVLLASRFIRGMFAGVSFHIMFDDMPYVDRVLQLCLDIYLVRESGELLLEEDLFAKLIFLYRSPETLIKWTRFPQTPASP